MVMMEVPMQSEPPHVALLKRVEALRAHPFAARRWPALLASLAGSLGAGEVTLADLTAVERMERIARESA